MADEDLVSQITVTGGNEAAKEVEDFANRGAQAFDKLGASVDKTAVKGAADMGKFERATLDAANAANKLGKVQIDPGGGNAQRLKDIERSTSSFVASLRQTTQAIGRFTQRIALVGAAAQAASIAFVEGARRIAQQAGPTTNALEKQTDAQIDANNASLSAQQAEIQHQSTLRQLFGQLSRGEITYTDYRKAVDAANRSYREQQRVAREVEAAQAAVKEENDRLKKSLADQQAFQKLVDTFGGPLTSALVAFGRQVEQTRQGFLAAFGPSLASAVDVIGTALGRNSQAINDFFNRANAQFQAFISNNGPAIQTALENIGKVAASVFEGLIAALPALIDLFNNQLVPAFKSVAGALDTIAVAVNSVFGTKLTAGAIALSIVILQLTGSLRLFFSLLRTIVPLIRLLTLLMGGPLTIAIAGLAAFLLTVDWSGFAARAQAAGQAIVGVWNSTVEAIKGFFNGLLAFFSTIWEGIKTGLQATIDFIVNLFNTVVEGIKAAWQGVVDFFTTMWDGIKALFQAGVDFLTNLWNNIRDGIVNAFTSAVNTVKNLFSQLLAAAKQFLQPIIDLLGKILSLSGSVDTSGGGAQGFKGGGHIRGPGTSTSDSIPIWASAGEFMVKAKAVAKYGLGFLHALNSGKLDLPAFNFGGFIAPSPVRQLAFAGGGEVTQRGSSLQPLNLTIGQDTFEGLLMPEEVGSKLTKFAVSRQNRSGGRKPAWFGNRRN